MRTSLTIALMLVFLLSCEKSSDNTVTKYVARVAGYDLNCSTCLLEFPDDSLTVKNRIGQSPGNLYHAVNLSKDEYLPGEMLEVEIRKAQPSELTSCLALYPASDYESIYITGKEDFTVYNFNDTTLLGSGKCASDPENKTFICFESVIGDSRCPQGAQCIWEGNASVQFRFEALNEEPAYFDLNTHPDYRSDTLIYGYRIKLTNVLPYPSLDLPASKRNYSAELMISKE